MFLHCLWPWLATSKGPTPPDFLKSKPRAGAFKEMPVNGKAKHFPPYFY